MSVNGKSYTIIKLLGKGKGGYSYLKAAVYIFLEPLFSFIGIVISIITRKSRKIYPALWISGIISCMLGFIVLL